MPKVLIICSSFPPQSTVGGVRPAMMAKYLPLLGWETHVLTCQYGYDHPARDEKMLLCHNVPEYRICRVELTLKEQSDYLRNRSLVKKLRDFVAIEKAFPPGQFDKIWIVAQEYYKASDFDAIWATAPDFPALRIGRELSKQLGIPWIADFRDISEQEDGICFEWRDRLFRLRAKLRRKMLVSSVTCLTSVSAFHCQTLKIKTGKPCKLIYNGYDSDLFYPLEPVKIDHFKIVYMGRILSKDLRNPCLLFEAMDALISEGRIEPGHIQISFYATEPQLLNDIASEFLSWKLCKLHDRVDYVDVPEILRSASILLLLTEYGRRGILTTKVFEYLAVERPVLCIRTEPESEIAVIVKNANVGFAGDDLQSVKEGILTYYKQWLNEGFCRVKCNRKYVDFFSREIQAEQLAQLLDRVAGV